MSAWYELFGTVKVKAGMKAQKTAERFAKEYGLTAEYTDNGDGTAEVSFFGGAFLSYSDIEEADEYAKTLGPLALEPTFLEFNFDNQEHGKLYVGPANKEKQARSQDALTEIGRLLACLTKAHKVKLRELLAKKGKR